MRIFKKNTSSYMIVPFGRLDKSCRITEQQVRDFLVRVGERDFEQLELVNQMGVKFRIRSQVVGFRNEFYVDRV